MKGIIEAIAAVAGQSSQSGTVFPAEELKKLANGRTLFWDETRQALLYRGPVENLEVALLPSYTCPRCGAVSYNRNDIAQRYCGRCHKFETNQ